MIKERNYGIDLFRLTAMLGIVIFHILGHGGVVNSLKLSMGGSYIAIWAITIVVYGSVDGYALLSGYVGYSEEKNINIRFEKYAKLWLQVTFYSFIITMLAKCVSLGEITFGSIIRALFPVTFGQYWYFCAYTGIFFLIPFLNRLIQNLKENELYILIVTIIIIYSVYAGIMGKFNDPFSIKNGASFIWLLLLYIIGASLKKLKIESRVSCRKALQTASVLLLFTWLTVIIIPRCTILILHREVGRGLLVSYTSPTILLASIFLLIVFSNIHPKKWLLKLIMYFSPATFGVYLIHDHPIVRKLFITDKFGGLVGENVIYMIAIILGTAIIIFGECLLIEKIRLKIFKCIKVDILTDKVGQYIKQFFGYFTGLMKER